MVMAARQVFNTVALIGNEEEAEKLLSCDNEQRRVENPQTSPDNVRG